MLIMLHICFLYLAKSLLLISLKKNGDISKKNSTIHWWEGYTYTVWPKKYAHGFCFAVLCCGYTLTDFPISIRLTSPALWQSNDCPSASKATLMNMDKYFMWINYERLHNHNKAKHNKTVCIFLGIYCTLSDPLFQPVFWRMPWLDTLPGPRLNIKTVLSTYGDFHVKDKPAVGRLIFNMGIAIPGKTVFLIETAPWFMWTKVSFSCNSCWQTVKLHNTFIGVTLSTVTVVTMPQLCR